MTSQRPEPDPAFGPLPYERTSRETLPYQALRGEHNFRRVRQRGKPGRSSLLTLRWIPGRRPLVEVGIVVSKKVGKAVVRNKVRRRLREAARRMGLPACQATVVALPEAAVATYHELADALRQAAGRAGLR